ncbi:hypothetical protein V7138_22830 [Bacillus sp. JJ1533]|uniref:hypothetical protein n=1 Tax=Bacillus sp. JJ1533 TaxID=3122959 RepID=UPI002FFE87BE
MSKIRVVKSTYNEGTQKESYIFIRSLIEKALLDELELSPTQKGMLIEQDNLKP